jgi:hypothetical protein
MLWLWSIQSGWGMNTEYPTEVYNLTIFLTIHSFLCIQVKSHSFPCLCQEIYAISAFFLVAGCLHFCGYKQVLMSNCLMISKLYMDVLISDELGKILMVVPRVIVLRHKDLVYYTWCLFFTYSNVVTEISFSFAYYCYRL